MINSAIEKAQKKIEARKLWYKKELTWNLMDVMNLQRKLFMKIEMKALGTDNLKDKILGMLKDIITAKVY